MKLSLASFLLLFAQFSDSNDTLAM
jgi:hypothetical protein